MSTVVVSQLSLGISSSGMIMINWLALGVVGVSQLLHALLLTLLSVMEPFLYSAGVVVGGGGNVVCHHKCLRLHRY